MRTHPKNHTWREAVDAAQAVLQREGLDERWIPNFYASDPSRGEIAVMFGWRLMHREQQGLYFDVSQDCTQFEVWFGGNPNGCGVTAKGALADFRKKLVESLEEMKDDLEEFDERTKTGI